MHFAIDPGAWEPIEHADPHHAGLYALWTSAGMTWGRQVGGAWVSWQGEAIEPTLFLGDPLPPLPEDDPRLT